VALGFVGFVSAGLGGTGFASACKTSATFLPPARWVWYASARPKPPGINTRIIGCSRQTRAITPHVAETRANWYANFEFRANGTDTGKASHSCQTARTKTGEFKMNSPVAYFHDGYLDCTPHTARNVMKVFFLSIAREVATGGFAKPPCDRFCPVGICGRPTGVSWVLTVKQGDSKLACL
jgi:hypothetical protein